MAVEGDPVAEKVQIRSFITACLSSPTKEEDEKRGRVRNAGEGLPAFQVQTLNKPDSDKFLLLQIT